MKKILFILLFLLQVGVANAATQESFASMWNPFYTEKNGTDQYLMDADGEKVGVPLNIYHAGDITKIHFMTETVTEGDTILLSLQDDSGAGVPDGTPDESGTQVIADVDDNTWFTVTLDSARTVARGDIVWVVLEYNSYVDGNLNIRLLNGLPAFLGSHARLNTAAAWSANSGGETGNFIIEYDTGIEYNPMMIPVTSCATTTSLTTATNPDEIGNYFSLPYPATIIGGRWNGRHTGDAQIVLYADDGTQLATTNTLDEDLTYTADLTGFGGYFTSSYNLVANTNYRLVLKPTTGTSVRFWYCTANAAGDFAQINNGTTWYKTSRVDAGSFTEDTSIIYQIYPLLISFDDAVGAGGSVTVGYSN